ncbi:hypothetical protein QTP70_029459 [Hemibagrus guttatus]|uniref:Uncharacterized protein n=1 Tax=Hemibagrus guttatus TaxID=175788 RepID=A0AAE0PRS7_9TELE|nr:hypothetical protein QTP70_029459 [Hemibagrus guttatus]
MNICCNFKGLEWAGLEVNFRVTSKYVFLHTYYDKVFRETRHEAHQDSATTLTGPLEFAYCPNCPTDDAITTTLHLALAHLHNKDSYV